MAEILTMPVPPGYVLPVAVNQTVNPPMANMGSIIDKAKQMMDMSARQMPARAYHPGDFCFGFDASICANLPIYKVGDTEFDTRSLCSGVTNFLCIFLVVGVLAVVLGVAVYGLILE